MARMGWMLLALWLAAWDSAIVDGGKGGELSHRREMSHNQRTGVTKFTEEAKAKLVSTDASGSATAQLPQLMGFGGMTASQEQPALPPPPAFPPLAPPPPGYVSLPRNYGDDYNSNNQNTLPYPTSGYDTTPSGYGTNPSDYGISGASSYLAPLPPIGGDTSNPYVPPTDYSDPYATGPYQSTDSYSGSYLPPPVTPSTSGLCPVCGGSHLPSTSTGTYATSSAHGDCTTSYGGGTTSYDHGTLYPPSASGTGSYLPSSSEIGSQSSSFAGSMPLTRARSGSRRSDASDTTYRASSTTGLSRRLSGGFNAGPLPSSRPSSSITGLRSSMTGLSLAQTPSAVPTRTLMKRSLSNQQEVKIDRTNGTITRKRTITVQETRPLTAEDERMYGVDALPADEGSQIRRNSRRNDSKAAVPASKKRTSRRKTHNNSTVVSQTGSQTVSRRSSTRRSGTSKAPSESKRKSSRRSGTANASVVRSKDGSLAMSIRRSATSTATGTASTASTIRGPSQTRRQSTSRASGVTRASTTTKKNGKKDK